MYHMGEALEKSFYDHIAKLKGGARIWERTPNGWRSRETTKKDIRALTTYVQTGEYYDPEEGEDDATETGKEAG